MSFELPRLLSSKVTSGTLLTPGNMTELEGKVEEFGDNLTGDSTCEFFEMVRDVFEIRVPAFRPLVNTLPGFDSAIQEFHRQLRVKLCESPTYFPAGVVDNIYRGFCGRITDGNFGPEALPLVDGWNLDEVLLSRATRELVWIGQVNEWKLDLVLEHLMEEAVADLKSELAFHYPRRMQQVFDIPEIQAEVGRITSFNLKWLLRWIPELEDSVKLKFTEEYNRKLARVTEDYLVENGRRDGKGSRTETTRLAEESSNQELGRIHEAEPESTYQTLMEENQETAPESASQSLIKENQEVMSNTRESGWTAISSTFGSFFRYIRDQVVQMQGAGFREDGRNPDGDEEEESVANVNVEEGEQANINKEEEEPEPGPSTSRAGGSGGGRDRKRKVASFADGVKKAKK